MHTFKIKPLYFSHRRHGGVQKPQLCGGAARKGAAGKEKERKQDRRADRESLRRDRQTEHGAF